MKLKCSVPILAFGFLGVSATGQERPAATLVPDDVNSWTIRQVATSLAKAGIPVGVILLPEDVAAQPRFVAGLERRDVLSQADTILASFEVRHPEYRVTRTESGGVLIAPSEAGSCAAFATSRRRSLTTSGKAHEVLYRIFRTWADETGPYVPPGLVGTGSVDSDPWPYTALVSLALEDASLLSALMALIEQAPGLGWAIEERAWSAAESPRTAPGLGCNIALFRGQSWLVTSDTFVLR
ncbi:MAG: hypothetical protein KJ066_19225 [Acidobacteria bacterium]|nr:hypothetical protein [Acidobacteriota bacterium]